MPIKPALWIVPINSPTCDQLLADSQTEIGLDELQFIRRDGKKRALRIVEQPVINGAPFVDADVNPASVVQIAIGTPDKAPTSGTFELAYLGNSSGLTALAYNIAEGTLQTALNANAAISGAGGVTVDKTSDGSYIITFTAVGARSLITSPENALVPASQVVITQIQAGDASNQEIQYLTLRQNYLAIVTLDREADGDLVVTDIQTGSSTQPEIRQISITGTPTGGTWSITYSQLAEWRLRPSANNATRTLWSITSWNVFVAPSTSPYFDVADNAGPVRIWFNYASSGTPPAIPGGGRLLEVPCALDNAEEAFTQLLSVLSSDTGLEAGIDYPYYQLDIRTRVAGVISDTGNDGTSNLTVTKNAVGTDGVLQNATFAFETVTGVVGFYININGNGVPTALAAYGDNLTLFPITTITPGMTANEVRDEIMDALNDSGLFTASNYTTAPSITVAGTITSTPIIATAFQSSNSLIGAQLIGAGGQKAGTLAFNDTAQNLQKAVGSDWTAVKSSDNPYQWQLTATSFGAKEPFITDGSQLVFAGIWTGDLNLNTQAMILQFSLEGNPEEISSVLEIQLTEPGAPTSKLYNAPCQIRADVIASDTIAGPPSPSFSGAPFTYYSTLTTRTGGSSIALDSLVTVGKQLLSVVTFIPTGEGLRGYRLESGTDAESSPWVIRPDDYSVSNQRVWKSIM